GRPVAGREELAHGLADLVERRREDSPVQAPLAPEGATDHRLVHTGLRGGRLPPDPGVPLGPENRGARRQQGLARGVRVPYVTFFQYLGHSDSALINQTFGLIKRSVDKIGRAG